MRRACLAFLLAVVAFGADYELAGRITPPGRASVSVFAVKDPFTASTIADREGHFAFKKLPPGSYTLAVFFPARGEARRTIEVGAGTADARRRVWLEWNLKDSEFTGADSLRGYHSVSARQLSVPDKAAREYQEAQKDLAKNDAGSAVAHLQRAVEIAPQFSAAWNHLGTIAYQTQKYERAETCFREALRLDPDSFEAVVNLGGVLINLNKLDEAWDYNLHAVLMRPADALANSQLGTTYFGMGKPELAEKYFVAAARIDPAHFSHPQLFLAEIHLRGGNRAAAADDMESFLKYHPDWPQAAKMRQVIEELRK